MPNSSTSPRIAITGIGLVTPHGPDVATSWRGLRDGVAAVRSIELADLLPHGVIPPVSPAWRSGWAGAPARLATSESDHPEPTIRLSLWAAREAAAQARLDAIPPERRGCVVGTSKGGLHSFAHLKLWGTTGAGAAPGGCDDFWRLVPPAGPAQEIALRCNCRGPLLSPVAACATGLVAMIRAARLLRSGECDIAVAGAGDASLQLPVLASFRRLGVQAEFTHNPAAACRPCDARRTGFLVGEGAGVVVMERWDDAVRRRVPILAEWLDGLERADPAGLTVLPENSECLVRLIRDLLLRCHTRPHEVQGVSLHATGTRMNDAYETRALAEVFNAAGSARGFGLKGGIGHLLGAAGSVEAVASICALRDQILPPTVNLEQPAADCPFPLTTFRAEPRPIERLLKVSLGFGGHLAACLLRRVAT